MLISISENAARLHNIHKTWPVRSIRHQRKKTKQKKNHVEASFHFQPFLIYQTKLQNRFIIPSSRPCGKCEHYTLWLKGTRKLQRTKPWKVKITRHFRKFWPVWTHSPLDSVHEDIYSAERTHIFIEKRYNCLYPRLYSVLEIFTYCGERHRLDPGPPRHHQNNVGVSSRRLLITCH